MPVAAVYTNIRAFFWSMLPAHTDTHTHLCRLQKTPFSRHFGPPFVHSPQQWQATNIQPHIHSDTENSHHTPACNQEQPIGTRAYTDQTGNTTCSSVKTDSMLHLLAVVTWVDVNARRLLRCPHTATFSEWRRGRVGQSDGYEEVWLLRKRIQNPGKLINLNNFTSTWKNKQDLFCSRTQTFSHTHTDKLTHRAIYDVGALKINLFNTVTHTVKISKKLLL